jgi:hypothetical protein
MLRRVALVCTNVSIIRVTRIGELGGTLEVASIRTTLRRNTITDNVVPSSPILVRLMTEAVRSSETSVLTRATPRNIPEDDILHSHFKSYIALTGWTL